MVKIDTQCRRDMSFLNYLGPLYVPLRLDEDSQFGSACYMKGAHNRVSMAKFNRLIVHSNISF